MPSVAPGAALRCSAGYDALPQPSVFSLMLADRWVMTSRCGGLELYKYKFGQHGAAEHREDNICFDLCNAYMTVYTTMPGGDAGHTQAAASPPEGRGRNRPAANLQQSRRQGAVPSESPTSAVPGE